MNNVLFVVHGMGSHADGWDAAVRTKLEEVAARYARFEGNGADLWKLVTLEPLGYDKLFRDTLAEWAEADQVIQFARLHTLEGAPDLDWLEPLVEQDPDFFWTHVVDVVMYRCFHLQRAALRTHVASKLVDRAPKNPDRDFGRCTVLAHSLGTAVIHDTLHLLETEPLDGMPSVFNPLNCRLRGIFMLANVSRVLQDDVLAYKSLVRGGPRNSKSSLCGSFHSFYHELDPFCVPHRFDPFAQAQGWSGLYNFVQSLNHFRDWDVHGFEHYLDHPRVHIPLLNTACGENVVKPKEAIDAVDRYAKFGGKFEAVPEIQAALKQAAAQLKRLHETSDLAVVFDVYLELERLFEGVRDQIDSLRRELVPEL